MRSLPFPSICYVTGHTLSIHLPGASSRENGHYCHREGKTAESLTPILGRSSCSSAPLECCLFSLLQDRVFRQRIAIRQWPSRLVISRSRESKPWKRAEERLFHNCNVTNGRVKTLRRNTARMDIGEPQCSRMTPCQWDASSAANWIATLANCTV